MITWREVPTDALLKLLEYCDGWNVLNGKALKEIRFPDKLIDPLNKTHEKNKNGKRAIQANDGSGLKSTTGVFTLDLLFSIAKDYELTADVIKAETVLDQSDQASILCKAIIKKISV